MEWYVPITIIPGIGMLVQSTSGLLLALNNEISSLINQKGKANIIERKLKQLKTLNYSMVSFYISIALLIIAGLIGSFFSELNLKNNHYTIYISILAILAALFGITYLVIYSFKAVKIRQDQHL